MVWVVGPITMPLIVALVTFRVAMPLIEVVGSVAVMVEVPTVNPAACPTLLIVATATGAELQVTEVVMLRSPPSV